MKNVLICEDHPVVGLGIKYLLESNFPKLNVYLCSDYEQALHYFSTVPIYMLVLDLNVPGGNSIKMLETFLYKQQQARILVFSAYDEKVYALPCLKAGAKGYISKHAAQEEVLLAVKTVFNNEKYLSPQMRQVSIDKLLHQAEEVDNNPLENLSDREKEVLHYLVKGYGPADIGRQLNLHISTISTVKNRVFSKLGVNSIVSLLETMRVLQSTPSVAV